MTTSTLARSRNRDDIDDADKWNLGDIYNGWEAWDAARIELVSLVAEYADLKGTLAEGPERLIAAYELNDRLGQLAYKVDCYPSLKYDEDQRDNAVNARRQQVHAILAQWMQATAWFSPELLAIPIDTVRGWIDGSSALARYRFAIEEVYRLHDHVLDERGEELLSYAARLSGSPAETYAALSTADAKFPEITLTTGEKVTLSPGGFRTVMLTSRSQADRRAAFEGHYGTYGRRLNTYASLYHGVCQRDWFHARSRGYATTLDRVLDGNNIPRAVLDNLIATTRAGVEPLRRYHRLRRRALALDEYYTYDSSLPLVEWDRRFPYADVLTDVVDAMAPIGEDYQARMRRAVRERWIDVYENEGKRSGAYSMPVYGVHSYMLMNWNDTLDAVFTLAHELGHSMHTSYSHERQPFVYADYTIFVAEVPSTLSEALLLEQLLKRSTDRTERIFLLQHAIDSIVGTFYMQTLFADFELAAHELVERDEPITAEVLSAIYRERFDAYLGDSVSVAKETCFNWARIPHFYSTPYYVYQYATCFASAAKLAEQISAPGPGSVDARNRYLELLAAGGSDHPMAQLKTAGVDLSQPDAIQAVVHQMDRLVTQLEELV